MAAIDINKGDLKKILLDADFLTSCNGYRVIVKSSVMLFYIIADELLVVEEDFERSTFRVLYKGKNLAAAAGTFEELLEAWKQERRLSVEWPRKAIRPSVPNLMPLVSEIIIRRTALRTAGIEFETEK